MSSGSAMVTAWPRSRRCGRTSPARVTTRRYENAVQSSRVVCGHGAGPAAGPDGRHRASPPAVESQQRAAAHGQGVDSDTADRQFAQQDADYLDGVAATLAWILCERPESPITRSCSHQLTTRDLKAERVHAEDVIEQARNPRTIGQLPPPWYGEGVKFTSPGSSATRPHHPSTRQAVAPTAETANCPPYSVPPPARALRSCGSSRRSGRVAGFPGSGRASPRRPRGGRTGSVRVRRRRSRVPTGYTSVIVRSASAAACSRHASAEVAFPTQNARSCIPVDSVAEVNDAARCNATAGCSQPRSGFHRKVEVRPPIPSGLNTRESGPGAAPRPGSQRRTGLPRRRTPGW